MEVIYPRCCGLYILKKSVVACVITPEEKEIRTFSTMTEDILAMVYWIKSKGCTHVAMESTGSYWKPIYNVLKIEGLYPMVVNAIHIKMYRAKKQM